MSKKKKHRNAPTKPSKNTKQKTSPLIFILIAIAVAGAILLGLYIGGVFNQTIKQPSEYEIERQKVISAVEYLNKKYDNEFIVEDSMMGNGWLVYGKNLEYPFVVYETSILDDMDDYWKKRFSGDFCDNGYVVVKGQQIYDYLSSMVPESFGTFRILTFFQPSVILPEDANVSMDIQTAFTKYADFFHCNTEIYVLTDANVSESDFNKLCDNLKELDFGIKLYVSQYPASSQSDITLDYVARTWGSNETSLFRATINYPQSDESE